MTPKRLERGDFLAGTTSAASSAKFASQATHRHQPVRHTIGSSWTPWQIRADQVGVRRSRWAATRSCSVGTRQSQYVVPEGDWRGVQDKPGRRHLYLNPYVESIVPVNVRSHRVEFTDIEFPSRDGFMLKPFVLVTYRVAPEWPPSCFVTADERGQIAPDRRDAHTNGSRMKSCRNRLPLIRGQCPHRGQQVRRARVYQRRRAAPGPPTRHRTRAERLQQVLLRRSCPAARRKAS